MNNFDWGKIKNGFSGFESLALRFVEDKFPSPNQWSQTHATRDGNRDGYTVIVGYQPYPLSEEQWWMEAKYSRSSDLLTRYRLDATIVSAILSGNVSKVIFVTNISISTKTKLDIRLALNRAAHCKDVFFCTKNTMEYWLSLNSIILAEYFSDESITLFEFPDVFVIDEIEYFSNIGQSLSFVEPLYVLQKHGTYNACFSVFSKEVCTLTIRKGRNVRGIRFLSCKQIELMAGENFIKIPFRIESEYFSGYIANPNIAPVFQLGSCEIASKYSVIIAGTKVEVDFRFQTSIYNEIKALVDNSCENSNFYLYCLRGDSGTGKSYVLDRVVESLFPNNNPIFYIGFSASIIESSRMLINLLIFILFPYLTPETLTKEYLGSFESKYVSRLLRDLVDNRDSIEGLNSIFSASYGTDDFFPVQININRRILILDDLQKLGEDQKRFLFELIIAANARKLPLVIILSGQPYSYGETFGMLRQKVAFTERQCSVSVADLAIKSPTIKHLIGALGVCWPESVFTNYIELFTFVRYIEDLDFEIDGLESLVLAGRAFRASGISEQYILDQFREAFTNNCEIRELCDNIYWSANGVLLSSVKVSNNGGIPYLLDMRLIRYGENNYLLPYHEIYQKYYRMHFPRPKSLHYAKVTPIQNMQDIISWEADWAKLNKLACKIEIMIKEQKFSSVFYILENYFASNRDDLLTRLGTQVYYRLFLCYAVAATNVSRTQSGRMLFELIKTETIYSLDPVLLEVCEEAAWELVNSQYEWLEFDNALATIGDLFQVIRKLQILGKRDNDIKKCIRYHDAMVIRALILSDQASVVAHQQHLEVCSQASVNGFEYRCLTFSVRYAQSIVAKSPIQAKEILTNCQMVLKKVRGDEDRYSLWSNFAIQYIDFMVNNDFQTFNSLLKAHERLKKNFFNDYRKKFYAIAACFYINNDIDSGNNYMLREVSVERELRPRQKGFYYETIALYEYLYGSSNLAEKTLKKASEIFRFLPSYQLIIEHNMQLLSVTCPAEKTVRFFLGDEMQPHIFYIDPRCAW